MALHAGSYVAFAQDAETRGPAEDPWTSGVGSSGVLLYPPRSPDEQGPIDSIRWELLREGLEDLEYMRMAEDLAGRLEQAEKAGAAKQGRDAVAAALALVERWPSVRSANDEPYTLDGLAVDAARKALAEAIVRMQGAKQAACKAGTQVFPTTDRGRRTMQHFSFDFGDPSYEIAGWKIGAQLITFENTYGLDPERTRVADGAIACGGLRWAGGQEQCGGEVAIAFEGQADSLILNISARHEKKIRCTKLILSGLPEGRLIGSRLIEHEIPDAGTILGWPQSGLPIPLVFLQNPDGGWRYFRSLDDRVRAKRIAVYRSGDGTVTVELIHEDAGHEMSGATVAPPWEIGSCDDPQTVIDAQMAHAERSFCLQPWETRLDVPDWAREISFVASIHMMHWSGYIFNTYEDALDVLRWVCERIDGKRVFAYLPGWEGRYYWRYGRYRPHERLGGDQGFRWLVDGAHELGARVCPMYGCNCANTGLENFEQWGAHSHLTSAGGYVMQGNKPDWDVSRAHDGGWQAWLNPGAPGWGNRLYEESAWLIEKFGVDATFYDTAGSWLNDPNHPVYEGMMRLRDRLKERFPDLLVTAEHWYSPLGAIFPVTHHWCPQNYPEVFAKYNRRWAHLSTGDPSRGSTGVHEMGTHAWEMPELSKDLWPTVTFVDGTVAEASDRVEQVIELAHEYSREYLE